MDTPKAPDWIRGYKRSQKSSEYWPLNWDPNMLDRIVVTSEIKAVFDQLWLQEAGDDSDFAQTLLEEVLSIRHRWEETPKVTAKQAESASVEVGDQTKALADRIERDDEVLRAHHANRQTVGTLFPELFANGENSAALASVDITDVLKRYAASVRKKVQFYGEAPLPERPTNRTAYRTFVVRRLVETFRRYGKRVSHSRIALLANFIVDDPAQILEASHVAKLDEEYQWSRRLGKELTP